MNTISLIVGNGCSLLAMVTDSLSSTQKTAKRVLMVQNLSQLTYGISCIVLKGYSGAVQNGVSILRNLIAICNIKSKLLEWAIVALGVALGLCFNNLGPVGYLPVIANLEYTLAVFRFKDNERALKIAFLIAAVMFSVFNAFIYNFVGVATNAVVVVTGVISLARAAKKQRENP